MFAIYKKELKSYFTSVIACLFIAVTTLIAGIFFVYYNLQNGMTSMYSVYQSLFILVFTVPILTMKIIADERRLKTDQLILTAPVSVGKIVFGKFLALATIFIIPILVMCLYPLILSQFGTIIFKTAYTNILGLFLYGLAFIAIGMFISSVTESQVISAILSIVVLLLGYLMGSLTSIISSDGNIFTKILGCFDLYTPMQNFLNGIITLSDVIYYISLIILFLFLTCQSIQKRRWEISKKFIGTGIFSAGFIAVVVVLVVFLNMIAGSVTSRAAWATQDMTAVSLYSISNDTKKMLKDLDNDITFYVMSSEANADATVKKTLERYQTNSKHIHVEYKDTTRYPNFYKEFTDTAPTAGSIIVYNDKTKKSKVVDYNDIYISDNYSYYYSGQSGASSYDCEGQLDSAIAYVRTENTYKIYQVEGHDEAVLDTTNFGTLNNLTDIIQKYNCEIEQIKLLSMKSIPNDECSALLLLGPKTDYTEDEATLVKEYLAKGGNAIIGIESMASIGTDKPNFYSILKEYNVEVKAGIIAENNSSFYAPQYGPFYAFAEGITGYATGLTSYVFTPYTVGLKQIDSKDSSITYTALASSSKDSVLKTNAANAKSYEKEKGDEEGPFDTVAAVTKTTEGNDSTEDEEKKKSDSSNETESNITSNILVFGSVYSLSDTMDTLVQGSNTQIVNNALKEYIDTDVTTISVPAKSLTSDTLTVTESGTRLFGILLAVVAPVIVLAAGIIVWVRRRKC
ncbi:Gldg family protein [uncultured Eubacterium sp.]|uniref:Gldg family protein n=1 Tax=uncultured Eubacterium sp. TaxID=165185 RepID=UPI002673182C|nr:Gldg family protein [uncultured Eubacterium sp.]